MKRRPSACDADYDVSPDPTAQQTKRQKLLEFDGVQVNLLAVCSCLNVAFLELHCESKKQDTKLLFISSPNIDRFLKFFLCYTQQEICNKKIITDTTHP